MTQSEKQYRLNQDDVNYFFKFFAEKAQTVFWVRDPGGERQLYVSPAYEKIFGRPASELYDDPQSFFDLVIPEDRTTLTAERRKQNIDDFGPDAQYEKRFRIQHPDGTIHWIKDTSFPIFDEKNKLIGFAGIGENITEDVLREQELRDAMERAEAANQAKSDFLAMMSHELRTPLNAILGMAQILRMKGVNQELEECIDIIAHAGNSLLALVSDILDFSKLEVGKLSFSHEPLDLHLLMSQVIYSLHHQAQEKGIELSIQYHQDAPAFILSDANRLRQVISNLLGNAIKFTDQGGVTIEVLALEKTAEKALMTISVVDTGVGISNDKLDHIFEKFSQIDSIYQRKHQGTGLGLAITKELVERMNGSIEVQSVLGKGSRFTVTIPFELQQPLLNKPLKTIFPGATQAAPQPVQQIETLKVLLVEDNFINQKIAKIMLEESGCQVDIRGSGEHVLGAETCLTDYDIIFMDIGLPDMSGFDLVKRIRDEVLVPSETPIVAMTAHVLERDREQCFAVGMDGIIAKPIVHEELLSTLKYWSRKK